jgi:hypothetical protein
MPAGDAFFQALFDAPALPIVFYGERSGLAATRRSIAGY